MIDGASEFGGLSEEVIAPREESVRRIKERKETDLKENFQQNLTAIREVFCVQQLAKWGKVLPAIATLSLESSQARTLLKLFKVEESFEKKTAAFRDYFDQTVFALIVHGSSDLGKELELKSPGLLASENGLNAKATAKSSGDLDVEIGNTDYVFGNSAWLQSRSLGGVVYEIMSKEGCAVPIDLADIRTTYDKLPEGVNWEREQLDQYAANIYSIADFKTIFAAYGATFFDSPREAIRFYRQYYHFAQQAACWTSDEMIEYQVDKGDQPAMRAMKNLLVTKNVVPPICPEFQFKSKVSAKRDDSFWQEERGPEELPLFKN